MPNDFSYGSYVPFKTVSKEEGFSLLGADNIIGDVYSLEVRRAEDGSSVAWLINRFGDAVGYFDAATTRRVQTMQARGWTTRALLSLVLFSSGTEDGTYSGEVLLLGNDAHYNVAFDGFAKTLQKKLSDSVRVDANLSPEGIRRVIESDGTWCPDGRVPLPNLDNTTHIAKDDRSISDKIVESGRNRSIGCMLGTVVFWAVVAAGLVFLGLKLFGVI